MTTYVLIPGACHGGWYYDPITAALRELGHEVHAPTLSPHGNLEEHAEEVLALLADLDDVVLAGHSYGGMVVTTVADRVPRKVKGLVYADAMVPADGQSVWDLAHGPWREWYVDGASADGRSVRPLPFFDPRAFAHPMASLLQRARLTGAVDGIANRWYLFAKGTEDSPFTQFRDAFRDDPAWRVLELDTPHNVLAGGQEQVLAALTAAGAAG
ncbi:alpha/beta fold hydrolase [Saccharothrix algeriensis]|uniref:Alpha/beta fold hydrolase n=1 Tax=Saccharothrix algeriensis TaxID=173560 RepID=A0A8T8HVX2_9PSEU|nr:alpha/beta fold hydrolase [Saccharothrix algeriensis]MBM7813925.1 pimeloyl-ACP methyl ester carboxylesterase [Saccharothrix algeriensis]QTR02350.1 alpha/beta fold hydrolase [Saccharothrix algeriensis]